MFKFLLIAIFLTSFQSLSCFYGGKKEISRLNFFDTDLLLSATNKKNGNVMVSPASIKSLLAMLLEGSKGATAKEIIKALRLSPDKKELREQLILNLMALQRNKNDTFVQNSNAIFVSDKLKLRPQYEKLLQEVYCTEIARLDFKNDESAVDTINKWVNNKTKGLIPFIVDRAHIRPSTDILVTNALYFKSVWKYSFDPLLSRPGCFHINGSCNSVVMMDLQAELKYAYVDDLRAHALELPYEGGRYSMILVSPIDSDGVTDLIRDMPYVSLPEILKQMEPTDVQLFMPKFSISYNEDMVNVLRDMRISSIFSTTSNLSGIFESSNPQINGVYHRVHLEVDERGTIAAAVSSAMIVPLIQNGVTLRVDRPFVFYIRDNHLGLVLFEGKIEEPTAYVKSDHVVPDNATKNTKTKGRYY